MSDPKNRQRSPNYPNVPLPEALERVRMIFEQDRTAPVDRSVAARHMGYAGKSGASDKMLGAIAQYGLLESVGKGETRVTQLAMDIFHPLDNQQKRRAIAEAAFRPEVFKTIRKHFGVGNIPSADALKSYLVRQQFMNRAIDPIIAAFTATSQFVKQEGATESDGPTAPIVEELSEPRDFSNSYAETFIAAKQAQVRNRIAHMTTTDQRVLTKGLLSKGATFEIIVSGQIGLKELNMLIRKLELDKEILAEDAGEGPDED